MISMHWWILASSWPSSAREEIGQARLISLKNEKLLSINRFYKSKCCLNYYIYEYY